MSTFGQKARISLAAALPIMAGYVSIGIPCGIMEAGLGFDPLMSFLVSATFYSGAGQFMICNMWAGGAALASIAASVSFVNTRQMLYSAAFSPFFAHARKGLTLLFSATVTDESFGVNLARFSSNEGWDPVSATLVNLFSMTSWAVSNAVGSVVGAAIAIPVGITSFAMTSIFVCLLFGSRLTKTEALVAVVSAVGVVVCKSVGLAGPAILVGACAGVAAGLVKRAVTQR